MSTAVATKTGSSTNTASDLYEEIANAVVAKISNIGLTKNATIPEVIHLVTKQIKKDQGASPDGTVLAKELSKQVTHIRSADPSILPTLTDLYEAAANRLQDSLDLLSASHDMPKAIVLLVHELATNASSIHAKSEAAVYATVCYLNSISCPPDAVFTGAETSIDV